jgi:iron complex outermembrane receptor protein
MFFKSNSPARTTAKLLSGASLGVMALATLSPAHAQEAAVPETVTVTGTLIKGINPVGTNIVTVDTTTIQRSGQLTTDQILSQIPQLTNVFNSIAVPPTGNTNFQGLRPSIRNIPATNITGGSTTLVLVDGHNWVGANALGTSPDPGIIPAGVLQRVDVLPDGGSSLYGANAITGVLNFITRSSYDGLKVSVAEGFADGYSSFDGNAMAGKDWGNGSLYLAFEQKSNSFLYNADRPYTSQDRTAIGGRDARGTACDLPNITVSSSVNYAVTARPANTPGALKANVTGPFGGLDPVTNAGKFNRCDTSLNTQLVPKEEADSIFSGFHQQLSPGVDLSAKLVWSNRLETQLGSVLSTTTTIDTTNPYFQSINGETQQTVQFNFAPYLAKNLGPTTANSFTNPSSIEVFQFTPELDAALPWGDWEVKVLANYGRSFSKSITRSLNSNALSLASRQQTINGVKSPALVADGTVGNAIDPYNIALTNPTLLNTLMNFGNLGKAVQHQDQVQASADGTLFDWEGGAIKGVIGAKYDWDDFNAEWNINWPMGQEAGSPVPGGQFNYAKTHRSIGSVYGEVVAPIIGDANALSFAKSLTLDISGRYDSYSDFGDAMTFKLGFTYVPFDELSIRGNMGTSYDAPSLADTLAPDGRYQYTPQRTTPNGTVPPGTSAADALRPSILIPGGNPNLGPELANTNSIGADFHPGDYGFIDFTGLDVSITAWHIFIEHQIGTANGGLLFTVPSYSKYYLINPTLAQLQAYGYTAAVGFPGPDLASAFAPGINPPYIATDARRNNLGNALLEGLDFGINYSREFDFGKISAGINGTTTLKSVTQADFGQPFNSIQASGVPLYTLSFNMGYSSGPLSVRTTVNYNPSYLQNPTSQAVTLYHQTRIGSFAPVNLTVSYDLTDLSSWTRGTSLSVAATNIFDIHPPLVLSGGTANGSTIGRYVQLSLVKEF